MSTAEQSESVEATLKRIDERTLLILQQFNRHLDQDREDFRDVRDLIAGIPTQAVAAVHDTLKTVGINPSNPTSHQADMAFIREVRDMAKEGKFFEPLRSAAEWHETQKTVKKAGVKAAAALMAASLLGLMWAGFAEKIRGLFL